MSSCWWPSHSARMFRDRSTRSKNSNRPARASASLGFCFRADQRSLRKATPSPAHTLRQKMASRRDSRPRRSWSKCRTNNRSRRSGQCAHNNSKRAVESAPPENATAQSSRSDRASAQASTAGCSRALGKSAANSAARFCQRVARRFMRVRRTSRADRPSRPGLRQNSDTLCRNTAGAPPGSSPDRQAGDCFPRARRAPAAPRDPSR